MIIIQYAWDDILNSTELNQLKEKLINEKIIKYLRGHNLDENQLDNITMREIAMEAASEAIQLYIKELEINPFNETWRIVEDPLSELANITKENQIRVLIFSIWSFPEYTSLLKKRAIILIGNFWIDQKMSEWRREYGESKMEILPPKETHLSSFANKLIAEELYNNLNV